jgi:predicted aspartyl protease
MLRILAAMAMLAHAAAPAAPPPSRAPATAPAAAPVRSDDRASVAMVPAAQRRWLRYEGRDALLFRATVAGRASWVLLDTGARYSAIDTGLARAAGLALADSRVRAQTPTGSLPTLMAQDVALVIPDHLSLRMTRSFSADLSHISAALGRPIGFVLGWELLGAFTLVVDTGNHFFYLARAGEIRVPRNLPSVPFARDTRRLPARIGDQWLSLELDTGHNGVIGLRPEVWDRVAPPGLKTSDGRMVAAEGEVHSFRTGRFPTVVIGPATLTDVPVSRRDMANTSADGIVGMALFQHLGFILDPSGGRLWLLPAGMAARVAGLPRVPAAAPPAPAAVPSAQ